MAETATAHPMDHIKIRDPEFDYGRIETGPVWSRSCPEFALLINALGVHVPYFEMYLVRTLTEARSKASTERLKADISAICGQEGRHAKHFILYNRYLARHYPKIAECDASARAYFSSHLKTDDFKRRVGFTAGYETFTFLAGMIFLDNYTRWFEDSDRTVKALWIWHQVEEVEHGAVAFNVYKDLFGDDEWYRKRMVLEALTHILTETTKAYVHMCAVEGYFRGPRRAWRALSFGARVIATMIRWSIPAFRSSYTPRNHPLANERQNPVAMAWRTFEDAGGFVAEIDRAKMQAIMAGPVR